MSPRKTPTGTHMTFGEHLEALRMALWRSVIGVAVVFIVCCIFGTDIVNVLTAPVTDALKNSGYEPLLYASYVAEPFVVYCKVSLIAALFVASPWVGYQLWKFVAAGLHPNEKKYVHIFAPLTVLLFIAGTLFSYFVLVRYGIQFLVNFGKDMGVKPIPDLDTQLMFVLVLSLIMGLIFQLPLIMLILTTIGLIPAKTYGKYRKIFIIVALTVAAIITPTQDAFNLCLATAPILILYELGIIICRVAERKKQKEDLAG